MENPSESDESKMIKEPLLSNPNPNPNTNPNPNPNPNPKGGFRTIPFIIANEALESVANFGLTPNMILYLTRDYHMETAQAAQIMLIWSSASFLTPVIGAFLADSCIGRYRIIGAGSIINLLGIFLLWLTSAIPQVRPAPCAEANAKCEPATRLQLLFLYTCFAVMSIGVGGIRSASMAFGIEQLDQKDKNLKNNAALESFFSWYYFTRTVSILIAMTFVVYIQDALGWKVGFGVPVVLMFLSTISFFLAAPFYVKSKTKTSLLTGFAQVIVASFKKWNIKLITIRASMDEMHYHHQRDTNLVQPTEKLRFLNKACIILNREEELTPDGNAASNPWNLCTVQQVEELKAVIKVIPIWSTGIIMAVVVNQSSLLVIQASTMDRHITSKFEIPSGSFQAFMLISIMISIALYDLVIIPLASKLRGKPTRLSQKQRMGYGMLLSFLSMPVLAIVESVRREIAIEKGFSDDPKAVVPMSAMWLVPNRFLAGVAEAFNGIGQNEFYYAELPKSMASVATNLLGLGNSAASLVASFILKSVDDFSGKGGEISWVSSNINKGHYDYYYWVLAGLAFANLVYYLVCSKAYVLVNEDDNQTVN